MTSLLMEHHTSGWCGSLRDDMELCIYMSRNCFQHGKRYISCSIPMTSVLVPLIPPKKNKLSVFVLINMKTANLKVCVYAESGMGSM